jgi:uncharacterized protein (DUF2062 family)
MFERLRRLAPSREAIESHRWLRWLGPALYHPRLWHMSRRGIALGAAIGVFFGLLIPIAQIPASAAAAVLLRANVPSAVASTLVTNPLTFPPIYYAAWRLGHAVLGTTPGRQQAADFQAAVARPAAHVDRTPVIGGAVQAADSATDGNWFVRAWQGVMRLGKPLILGLALLACGFGVAVYLLISFVWHVRVRLKRWRRLSRPAATSP